MDTSNTPQYLHVLETTVNPSPEVAEALTGLLQAISKFANDPKQPKEATLLRAIKNYRKVLYTDRQLKAKATRNLRKVKLGSRRELLGTSGLVDFK